MYKISLGKNRNTKFLEATVAKSARNFVLFLSVHYRLSFDFKLLKRVGKVASIFVFLIVVVRVVCPLFVAFSSHAVVVVVHHSRSI